LIDPADHIGLVRHVLKRYRNVVVIEQEELYSIAVIGLVKAAKSFDPKFGSSFSTYAVPAIKNTVNHYLSEHMSYGRVSRRTKIVMVKIGEKFDQTQDDEALAKQFNVPIRYVKWARELYNLQVMHFDRENTEDEDASFHDMFGKRQDFTQVLVDEFLIQLPPKQRQVIELKMAGYGQTEIAKIIGIKQPQVSRYLKKAGELYRKLG